MMRDGIRLGSDGDRFLVQRLADGAVLSPPFGTLWDLRGWLMIRGYTAHAVAFFLMYTTGPFPAALVEGPEAA